MQSFLFLPVTRQYFFSEGQLAHVHAVFLKGILSFVMLLNGREVKFFKKIVKKANGLEHLVKSELQIVMRNTILLICVYKVISDSKRD